MINSRPLNSHNHYTITFPNFMPVVCEIARTSASAGSIITSAITSRLMTKATVITLDDDFPFC